MGLSARGADRDNDTKTLSNEDSVGVCVRASMGRGLVKKGFRSIQVWWSALGGPSFILCALALLVCFTNNLLAQGLPGGGGSGLAASGEDAAQKLLQEKGGKNTFRVDPQSGSGGVSSEKDVLENMKKLFDKIYLPPNQSMMRKPELDKWFSPHLRDINVSMGSRFTEVNGPTGRSQAGSPEAYIVLIYGGSCSGACPWCDWPDQHRSMFCCGISTQSYQNLVLDTNFKACCVKQGEQMLSREDIACLHPNGDGWAGLFEYYFPTTAIGWESQRGTTMIATNKQVKQCMESSKQMMENSNWITAAIQKGGQSSDGSITAKVADSIQGIRQNQKDPSLTFTDSLQGGGLTMRVNFAHMDPQERKALAKQYCMHEEQFMKLMDPQYDTKQIGGGSSLAALQALPIWANYCPQAVQLMTNPNETNRVVNTDGTKTNFVQGMSVYQSDPLYCQKMNAKANPVGGEFLKEGVLKNQGSGMFSEQSVGYTCRTGSMQEGGFSTRMVPVTLYSTAKIDPRTLDHAIPFLHAGGYYQGQMSNGVQSIYKRFEPIPYSQTFNLFSGKPWKGGGPNERGDFCQSYEGNDYQGKNQPDQLYISDVNHKPFTQEQVQEFKKYDREWADKQQENFHNRNFNESVLNYGAAFRIFATCPAGYVRWRGGHAEESQEACGEENFGGITPGAF